MESIVRKLVGLERIQTGSFVTTTTEDQSIEGREVVATNVEIKTSLTFEPHEYVADGDHQVSYNAGVTDESKLLPTHEKQLTQALQRFDGWTTLVRVEPTIRKFFDHDMGREKITIYTRLITADTREVTP